jgi:soluble lytic murein transglycosylase-like protein
MKSTLILATCVGLFALTAAVFRMYAEQEPVVLSAKIPHEIVFSSSSQEHRSLEESSVFVAAIASAAAAASSSGQVHYPTASAAGRLLDAAQLSGAQIAGQAAVQQLSAQKPTQLKSSPVPKNSDHIAVPKPVAPPAEPAQESPQPKPELPPSEWDGLFVQYATLYGVEARKLKVIAKCESTYRQDAVNGPYGGMYQYLASTWSSTRTAMGADPNPELRFNGEEAIKTTAWKIAHGGIGAWPHCGKL